MESQFIACQSHNYRFMQKEKRQFSRQNREKVDSSVRRGPKSPKPAKEAGLKSREGGVLFLSHSALPSPPRTNWLLSRHPPIAHKRPSLTLSSRRHLLSLFFPRKAILVSNGGGFGRKGGGKGPNEISISRFLGST